MCNILNRLMRVFVWVPFLRSLSFPSPDEHLSTIAGAAAGDHGGGCSGGVIIMIMVMVMVIIMSFAFVGFGSDVGHCLVQ